MDICTITKSGKLTHCGVKLAAYTIFYPSFDEKAIDNFCLRYAEAFESAIRGRIENRLIAEYEASDDPKKRFHTAPCEISLYYRITQTENGLLSMVWHAQIKRKRETIALARRAQTWDSRDWQLLLACDFGVGGKLGKTCNFFIEEGEVVILNGTEERKAPLKYRSRAFSRPKKQADSKVLP